MSNLELLDRAAGTTTCQILNRAGGALIDVGVWTLWTGKASLVPFGAGALSLLASNYLCPDMPMGGTPPVPGVDGCQKIEDGGYGSLMVNYGAGSWSFLSAGGQGASATEITGTSIFDEPDGRGYAASVQFKSTSQPNGYSYQVGWYPTKEQAAALRYRIEPVSGDCAKQGDEPSPIPPEAVQPITYNDDITNCTYNVTLQGFAQESEGGSVQPVYLVEGATQQRTEGGRMGGCNFPPTIYTPGGGGGGGGVYFPVPTPITDPGDGVPWWVAPLAGALGGAVLNQLADAIDDAFAPVFEPASFTLTAPCDVDESGNPQFRTWDFEKGNFQERVNAHQVALMEIMQQHLDWKTPICREQRPQPEGTWISTRWISDGNSPGGERPLRKLFRYRSKSTLTEQQLREYWADFVWEAGPVCVIHKGAWWGTPQVWASTAEEGKRVIRRAGAEAGLDPDQTGEWLTRSSDSPRYGMPGTMRLEAPNGTRWVTRREGPSAVPS